MNDNQEPDQSWMNGAKEQAALWTLLDNRGPRETLSGIFAWALYSQGEDGAIKARIRKAFIATKLGRLTRRMDAFEAELAEKTDDELIELLSEWQTKQEIEELENEVERSTEDASNDSNERDAGDWWKGECE